MTDAFEKGRRQFMVEMGSLKFRIVPDLPKEPTPDEQRVIDEEHTDMDEPIEIDKDHDHSLDGIAEQLNREGF